jgi:dipeptidyl aminopeptidase/acylaminoacyl peptidase
MRRWLRVLLVAIGLSLIAGGVLLAEVYLRLPARRRVVLPGSVAESISQKGNGSWSPAVIRAADGAALEGWLFRPRNASGRAVVLLHGLGDSRRGMTGYATFFLRHGYTVLTPDSRGHGASGGDPITYGLRESEDLIRWLAFLGDQGSGRLYALGASMGAAVTLEALGRAAPLRAVVAECAYASFRQAAYDRLALRNRVPAFLFVPFIEMGMIYARLRYGTDLSRISPVESIRGSRVPILLIHGTADRVVPVAHSRLLKEASPSAMLWEVENARHVRAWNVQPLEYERRVLTWFQTH